MSDEHAGSAPADLMSLVTHELRLPLTSIKGYNDLVRREMVGPLNEQQKQFLGIVARNVERMTALIDSLAVINRMRTDRLPLERAPLDTAEVVDEAVASLREALVGKSQSLTLELPEDLPSILGDHDRVVQVLSILLSNAHLYTAEGGAITVRARIEADQEHLRLTVRDDGPGIAEADRNQLFGQFFRSADESVREQSGWGLGLYIASELVRRQGGEIWCLSEPGHGSAFSFTMPLVPGG